tara:strand:- start:7061 stop:7564 length:504 start_codon:yes stop_codon:yes gene_type:complete
VIDAFRSITLILLNKGDNNMTNLSTFRNALQAFDVNHLTPYAVGFDRQFDRLWDYANHQAESTGFPPYNIVKDGDYNFTIEMALAGYGKDDIEVEVAEGVLSIKSVKESKDEDDKLYRGIATRNFTRKFTLADDIVVKGGSLKDGMLSIQLERVIPEEKKPRLIDIK